MPKRISVPGPGPEPQEEARQLAEAVSDMHYVSGTIVEAATELVPGESVDELITAWSESLRDTSWHLPPSNLETALRFCREAIRFVPFQKRSPQEPAFAVRSLRSA